MNGRKIFLDNKIIILTDQLPEPVTGGDVFFDSPSPGEMRDAYQSFEHDHSRRRLVFVKKDDGETLFRSFLTMFEYVEAAGGRVTNSRGELLMIFRYGRWDLPKGKISSTIRGEETPVEAAVREVMEETGLSDVIPGKELPSTYHIFTHKNKRILKRTYWFEMTAPGNQPLVPQLEEDISVAKWVSDKEIIDLSRNTYASLKDLLSLA